jgi:hypothetical protein
MHNNAANRICQFLEIFRKNIIFLEDIFPLHNPVYFIVVFSSSVLYEFYIFAFVIISVCLPFSCFSSYRHYNNLI